MMKRKLGINVDCIKGMSPVDALDLIREIGFETFFTGCLDDKILGALAQKAAQYGMDFETIHAPFSGINNMWTPGLEYLTVYNGMKRTIDLAAAHGVPAIVMHPSGGWCPPGISDLGLQRFDELVLYAGEKGVQVAFENLRPAGHLAYFVDRYEKLDHVRFCYDFGHEHCYTKTVQWMDFFCHKLICTHIHDNHGRGWEKTGDPDIHLLPFDGNIDYVRVMRKLDEYDYQGPLTLEVFSSSNPELSPEAFLRLAYERLQRLAAL